MIKNYLYIVITYNIDTDVILEQKIFKDIDDAIYYCRKQNYILGNDKKAIIIETLELI